MSVDHTAQNVSVHHVINSFEIETHTAVQFTPNLTTDVNLMSLTRLPLAEGGDDTVEKVDRAVCQMMKNLSYKCFKRVTVKIGGKKEAKVDRPADDEDEQILQRRREIFQSQMELIAREGAQMGQIYSLRQIICGNAKKVKQVPAAVRDSQTGDIQYEVDSIKKAVNDHVASTLTDRPPLPRYEAMALTSPKYES